MLRSAAPEFDHLRSPQARYAAHAAACLGYSFQSLDDADGYLFEVRDGARRAVFAAGAGSPYALNDLRAASIARDKVFCAEVLRRARVAVLPGRMFFVTSRWRDMRGSGREPEDAIAYVRRATLPIFCKPVAASNGVYAEIIETREAFADYMRRVSVEHFAILIQPVFYALEHRVFVLNGAPLFSYRKNMPTVLGDGVSTLGALIASMLPRGSAFAMPPAGRNLAGVRIELHEVPNFGEPLWLEGPANRAMGGTTSVVYDGAMQYLADVAVAAADAVGLRLAAVDLFELPAGPTVIEVNSNPMIATLEDHGRWDLIETIWRANIEAALR